MLRSKKDVDRHVRDLLNKTKTEDERKVRGYNIARLYYNIGEFGSSARYLAEFLMVRPRAVDAHRLLGQVQEGLGNKEKAVQAYKTAYELGEGQKDLLLKICELYTEVEADSSVRLYWAEEGQRHYPHRESVVKLREVLLSRDGTQSREELEKLYMEEIKASPMDVRLQTNLLRLYREWGADDSSMLCEAYQYGCQVEARKAFSDSLQWYQTLLDVMQAYEGTKDVSQDKEFYTNYLSALERLVYLTLASCSESALLSQSTLQDAVTLLHKFDQSLKSHLHVVGQKTMFGQLMVGQLYLHMAIFLIHNAKKEGLTQANTTSAALLFHACRFRPPEKAKTTKARENFWYKLACHRMSQAAHVLQHMAGAGNERTAFLDRVKQQCSNKEAQLNIHQSVFGASSGSNKDSDGSFFLSDEEFITAPLQYPEVEQVKEWDHVVGIMYCASLGDLVWLCLQQAPENLREPQPYYSFSLFEGLQFSSASVNTWAPETLCHLDLLAFLAATVYCQRVAAKETHGPPPVMLPTVLSPTLCTPEQSECWGAAHTLFNNRAHHRLGKLRLTLQRGLEVIRAHGNHGIDLPLMAHLAQCFTNWVSVAESDGSASSEVEALRERAEHYWQRVLLCLRTTRNIMSVAPRNPLFVAPGMDLSKEERSKVEEEGKFFLAMRLVQAGKQQDAIQALGELKSPEAAFQRAMLYNEQAQAVVSEGGVESATPEARAQQASLLTQARDTLYLTLDRLRMPGVDRYHPLNAKLSQQLEDVERRLSLLTSAGQGVHHHRHHHHQEDDTESLSDSSHSPHDLTNGHDPTSSPHLALHSTPMARHFSTSTSSPLKSSSRAMRQEARPSPERLHAQVQALSKVQETTLRNMEEQNTALKAQNDALRDLCTSMADGFRENSSLYRSMLEQNRAISQDAYTSVLGEVRQMHATIKENQAQLRSLAADIADLRTMRAATATPPKLPETAEVKQAEEVPVDIPAAVVPPGLYGGYVGYYSQPSPLMPTPGLFGNPPFFPPSTVPEQTYSIASSVNQGAGVTTIAQASTGSIANPTPCSPATISVPSPSATSLAHSHAVGSWSVSSSMAGSNRTQQTCSDVPAPPHAFQIAMPPTSNALTPPPRSSMPGELLSHSLPCSTTAGLLANVPPPLYSAVTPDSSPVRGQSNVRSLSSKLSTEGMSPAPNSLVAPSTTAGSQDTSSLTFPGGFRSATAAAPETKVSPAKVRESEDDNECYVEDDHDPCPDYKPLVPLPEKVEVRTGEEDEQVLFEERARLFRFVDKEWKERGTGVMKLLHNPGQESARVLMRRDQTYKICANHLITSNIDLQPLKGNDKVWIWAAQDYADEELRTEKFCCRFKTPEVANNFRDAFLKAKAIAKAKEEAPSTVQQPQSAVSNTGSGTASSLAMMFKPALGSWKCDMCLLTNKQEAAQCVACTSPNPNASTPVKEESNNAAASPFASFKFSPSSIPAEGTASIASPAASFGFKFTGTPATAATTTAAALPKTAASTVAATPTAATTSTPFGFKFTLNDTAATSQSVSITTPSSTTTTTPAAPTSSAANTSKESGKISLSGFTFTTTPSLVVEKKPEEPKEEKKEFVFAGFSFGSSSTTSAPSTGFTFATPSNSTAGSGSIFGGMSPSFGSLASTAATTTPTTAASMFTTKAFEPQPSMAVTKSPQKDDSDDRVEEYEPQVDFQPVVPMPDLVEIKTGEEGEEVLFCERSKLFRFDKDTKEWKERGLGDLKILKNNTNGKVRVLMRRELVLKVCANHFITPDLKLAPMSSSDRAWIWATPDFADEEMREERFAARFKTVEQALAFKEAFEKAQKMVEAAPAEETAEPAPVTTTTAAAAPSLASLFAPAAGSWECQACFVRNNAADASCVSCSTPRATPGSEKAAALPKEQPKATSSLAGMFRPPEGSWECDQCLLRNEAKSQVCVACGNSAPGAKDAENQAVDFSKGASPTAASTSSGALAPGTFKFGAEISQTFTFGVPQNQPASTASSTAQPAFTFGLNTAADNIVKPATFSFGINTTTDTSGTPKDTTTTAKPAQPAFSFGSTTTATTKPFSFTWKPPSSTGATVTFAPTQPVAIPSSQHVEATTPQSGTTPTKENKGGFVFGSPGKYEFSFAGVKAKSPRSRDISLCESEEGVVEEDEGDHLYFEPVVPLPDKVEVVTGEEEEEVLYSHRAKLFRLTQGEWKERGIGDVKILRHGMTGKIRLLMRREQVHKLCLNHYLMKDLEMRHKDDKTFYWAAMDHSEADTPKAETFAIRFKTPEIATEFFEAIQEAKVRLGGTATELPKLDSTSPVKIEKTPSTSATPTPTKAPQSNVAVIAQADSSTPTIKTEPAMPTAGFFSSATKSLFGDSTASSPATLFGSTPTTTTTTTTTSSFFRSTPNTSSFTSSSFGNTSVFGGPPAFNVNVSTNFSLRGSLPISIPTGSMTSKFSLFGGATTTSSVPRSSFSFGDKFSSEPDTSDEIHVVYEKKATPEQIERARKLLLPNNFFMYEDASPCPGCRGCENDSAGEDEVVKITASTPAFGGSPLKPMFGSTPTTTSATFGSPSIFGGSATFTTTTTASSFFTAKPSIFSSPGFFGSGTPPTTTTPSIFGGSTTASIFGGSPAASSTPGLLFGGSTTTTTTTASSTPTIFGGASSSTPSTTSTPSLFSNFSASTSTPPASMFSASVSSNKLFGTSTSAPTPGFFTASLAAANAAAASAAAANATSTPSSIFASPLASSQGSGTGPFGGKGTISAMLQSTQSAPSTTPTASPLFGGGGTLFSTPKEGGSQISFADLADSAGDAFSKKSLDPKAAAVWASHGQPVFGAKASPKKGSDGEEDLDESGEAHDPHFEPVVPLPDLVEVKTGEENLEVVFCNRAKLYRYDGPTKQWKERGIGDFKILHDPVTAKYRLLQRREQVHKLCCNHYLTTQLELHPLQSSETAWCWYAIDFSEKPEGVKEQLAVKFKTVELAKEFKTKFEDCQEQLRRNQAAADSSSTSTSAVVVLPLTTATQQHHDEEEDAENEDDDEEGDEEVEEEEEEDDEADTEDEDEEEDEDDDDDDDDDTSVMFTERCSLSKKEKDHWRLMGVGQLTMRYDDDVFGARITVTSDSGDVLAEHIIAIQTTMHQEGQSATWSVLNLRPEPQGPSTFKATFYSQEAIDMFAKSFVEAKEYAENSNLAEEPGLVLGEVAAADLYYGQGADKD
ncbi:hypothetical protein O3P69_005465 [Scylla paramamosain]|uniref:Nuclear pore complex protein Nup153 n=2 Tax=Scylla paramamosain TaxID=85552 RepID=A0AAW0UAQ1_SCYPA